MRKKIEKSKREKELEKQDLCFDLLLERLKRFSAEESRQSATLEQSSSIIRSVLSSETSYHVARTGYHIQRGRTLVLFKYLHALFF